ncbi:hypothetical protein C0J52_18115 [Blattella germanica]|nr:hypothetical protein C0J52_18115 [Blattella germanica]
MATTAGAEYIRLKPDTSETRTDGEKHSSPPPPHQVNLPIKTPTVRYTPHNGWSRYKAAVKSLLPFRRKRNEGVGLPIDNVGFFSYITFSWLLDIVHIIDESNLPTCSPLDSCDINGQRLQHIWREESLHTGQKGLRTLTVMWRFVRTRVIIAALIYILGVSISVLGLIIFLQNLIESDDTSEALVWASGLVFTELIVSLLGTDGQKIYDAVLYGFHVMTGPIIFILCILFSQIIVYDGNTLFNLDSLVAATVFLLTYPLLHVLVNLGSHFSVLGTALCRRRMALVHEMLAHLRLVKMTMWENVLSRYLRRTRHKELKFIWQQFILDRVSSLLMQLIPIMALLLFLYSKTDQYLEASKIIPLIALFCGQMRDSLNTFWFGVKKISEVLPSLKRFKSIMLLIETNKFTEKPINRLMAVNISHANFVWDSVEDPFKKSKKIKKRPMSMTLELNELTVSNEPVAALTDISFLVPKGKLIGVCGLSKCGKSSLLLSILGHLHQTCGQVLRDGSCAYVGQRPWIWTASIRDNIVFKEPFQHKRDIYLLDNPLSMVDADTAASVFDKTILKALKDRTVILATRHVQFLTRCDEVYLLDCGKIVTYGTHEDLMLQCPKYSDLVRIYTHENSKKYFVDTNRRHDSESSMTAFLSQHIQPVDSMNSLNSCADEKVDCALPSSLAQLLQNITYFLCMIFFLVYVSPYCVTVILLTVMVTLFLLARPHRRSILKIYAMEVGSRAPLYQHLVTSITGRTYIQAFLKEKDFIADFTRKCDDNAACNYLLSVAMFWLAVRVRCLGAVTVGIVAVLVILTHPILWMETFPSQWIAGISLIIVMQLGQCLHHILQAGCESQAGLNLFAESSQCIQGIKSEDQQIKIKTSTLPANWPTNGSIAFEDVKTAPIPGSLQTLNKMAFEITSGQKIGVVGLPGSGKKLLVDALFHLVELTHGKILIGGTDIKTVPLEKLRSSLAIVPQDPILFTGSIRLNLDPHRSYRDSELWESLQKVNLKERIERLPGQLNTPVDRNGDKLSVGERQLLCLARACLKDTKVLIVEEPLAAVNSELEFILNYVALDLFPNATILTIAHQMRYVVRCDKVMVVQMGKVIEFDSPSKLYRNRNSFFSRMITASTGDLFETEL